MKAIIWLACLVACASEPVGRVCGLAPHADEVVIETPALDCVSRTCLNGLCTAECDSDEDCERDPASPCTSGFACAIAAGVGPFRCRKLCMCRDDDIPPRPLACGVSD